MFTKLALATGVCLTIHFCSPDLAVGQDIDPDAPSLAAQVLTFRQCGVNDGLLTVHLRQPLEQEQIDAAKDQLMPNLASLDCGSQPCLQELFDGAETGLARVNVSVPVGTTAAIAVMLRSLDVVESADTFLAACGALETEYNNYSFQSVSTAESLLNGTSELRELFDPIVFELPAQGSAQNSGLPFEARFSGGRADTLFGRNVLIYEVIYPSEFSRGKAGSWDSFNLEIVVFRNIRSTMRDLTFSIDIDEAKTRRRTLNSVVPDRGHFVDPLRLREHRRINQAFMTMLSTILEERFPPAN